MHERETIVFHPWVGGLGKPHHDAIELSNGRWGVKPEYVMEVVPYFDVMLWWDDEDGCMVAHYDAKGRKFRSR